MAGSSSMEAHTDRGPTEAAGEELAAAAAAARGGLGAWLMRSGVEGSSGGVWVRVGIDIERGARPQYILWV